MEDRNSDNLLRVNPGFGKPRFSKKEIIDITISVVVLSVAFTILHRNNQAFLFYFSGTLGESMQYLGLFGTCLVVVFMSFLLHEFGHKFVAQNHGLWSEYRMWPAGLVLTLITSFLGFLFAAPGAVMIAGNMDSETNGKISIAGPIVNIIISAIGIIGCFTINYSGWVILVFMLGNLNAFLALFNLLPVPPLDGSKIVSWNPIIWVIAIAIAAVEVYVMMFCIPALYVVV